MPMPANTLPDIVECFPTEYRTPDDPPGWIGWKAIGGGKQYGALWAVDQDARGTPAHEAYRKKAYEDGVKCMKEHNLWNGEPVPFEFPNG